MWPDLQLDMLIVPSHNPELAHLGARAAKFRNHHPPATRFDNLGARAAKSKNAPLAVTDLAIAAEHA
jgi:hypothetical protein